MKRRIEFGVLVVSFGLAGYAFWGLGGFAPDDRMVDPPSVTAPVAIEVPAEVVEVVEPTIPSIDVLPESVSQLLAENGNASLMERSTLEEALPASIVAVLVDEGVVLRVADPAGVASPEVAP